MSAPVAPEKQKITNVRRIFGWCWDATLGQLVPGLRIGGVETPNLDPFDATANPNGWKPDDLMTYRFFDAYMESLASELAQQRALLVKLTDATLASVAIQREAFEASSLESPDLGDSDDL